MAAKKDKKMCMGRYDLQLWHILWCATETFFWRMVKRTGDYTPRETKGSIPTQWKKRHVLPLFKPSVSCMYIIANETIL